MTNDGPKSPMETPEGKLVFFLCLGWLILCGILHALSLIKVYS